MRTERMRAGKAQPHRLGVTVTQFPFGAQLNEHGPFRRIALLVVWGSTGACLNHTFTEQMSLGDYLKTTMARPLS